MYIPLQRLALSLALIAALPAAGRREWVDPVHVPTPVDVPIASEPVPEPEFTGSVQARAAIHLPTNARCNSTAYQLESRTVRVHRC
jgi:hypothetical protein